MKKKLGVLLLVVILAFNGCSMGANSGNSLGKSDTQLTPHSKEELEKSSQLVENRSPLQPAAYYPLPLGNIKAKGWLLQQLENQKNNISGDAEELYYELGENSFWKGGTEPGSMYDAAPYYIKGLVALAYTLEDRELIQKSQSWVDSIITSQNEDGSFGPNTPYDWWSRMLVMYALSDYYSATSDVRILPFMTNYYHYMEENIKIDPLENWGRQRIGDLIDNIIWLYNRTGDEFLISLIDVVRSQSDDLLTMYSQYEFFDYPGSIFQSHGVNVNQTMKFAPVISQLTGDVEDERTFYLSAYLLNKYNGQINGMPSGSEVLSGVSTTQGVELCSIVERMQSDEEAQMILGEAWIGDELEKIAFNAWPSVLDNEMKLHQYYSQPNQIQSLYDGNADLSFRQNHYNDLLLSPVSGWPCCRFNIHNGWPYYVKNMWGQTSEGGLVLLAYGPSEVTINAGGKNVRITEDTNYPFEEQVRLTVNTDSDVNFPLILRIPSWANNPTIQINGISQTDIASGKYHMIDREWKNGDVVTINLPMLVKSYTGVNDSVGLELGPLVFSLDMNENLKKHEVIDMFQFGTQLTRYNLIQGYSEYELTSSQAWNYALDIDPDNPGKDVNIERSPMSVNPFKATDSPIKLIVRGRQLQEWGVMPDGITAHEPPFSPVQSAEPIKTLTLIPYGSQNIRVSMFPVLTRNDMQTAEIYYAKDTHLEGNAKIKSSSFAAMGEYVGDINEQGDFAEFTNINAPADGIYELQIWFANGTDYSAYHILSVNNVEQLIKYPSTTGWGIFQMHPVPVKLKKGANTLRFGYSSNYAEIDFIRITSSKRSEAEKAFIHNAAILNNQPEASEGQYVGDIINSDSYIDFYIEAPVPGSYNLRIQYANGGGSTDQKVFVNGDENGIIIYAPTSGLGKFDFVTKTVQLVGGLNTVRLQKGDSGSVQLDYISLE